MATATKRAMARAVRGMVMATRGWATKRAIARAAKAIAMAKKRAMVTATTGAIGTATRVEGK